MRHNRNSTQDYLSHTETFNDREAAIKYLNEQKNKFERKTFEGMKAKIFINGYAYFGRYYIETGIMPLLITADPIYIAAQIREVSPETIHAEIAQREAEAQARAEKSEQDKAQREAKRAAAEAQINHLQQASKLEAGGVYITFNGTNFTIYVATEKSSFGKVKCKFYRTDTPQYNPDAILTDANKGKGINMIYFARAIYKINQTQDKPKPQLEPQKETNNGNDITAEYYKNSILIKGNGTYKLKNKFKDNGGVWNKFLNGWIFSQNNNMAKQFITN